MVKGTIVTSYGTMHTSNFDMKAFIILIGLLLIQCNQHLVRQGVQIHLSDFQQKRLSCSLFLVATFGQRCCPTFLFLSFFWGGGGFGTFFCVEGLVTGICDADKMYELPKQFCPK